MVSCPKCGKEMQAKHLAYGHCCKGSVADRSAEAPARATEAFNRRLAYGFASTVPIEAELANPHAGLSLLAELDAALGRP